MSSYVVMTTVTSDVTSGYTPIIGYNTDTKMIKTGEYFYYSRYPVDRKIPFCKYRDWRNITSMRSLEEKTHNYKVHVSPGIKTRLTHN